MPSLATRARRPGAGCERAFAACGWVTCASATCAFATCASMTNASAARTFADARTRSPPPARATARFTPRTPRARCKRKRRARERASRPRRERTGRTRVRHERARCDRTPRPSVRSNGAGPPPRGFRHVGHCSAGRRRRRGERAARVARESGRHGARRADDRCRLVRPCATRGRRRSALRAAPGRGGNARERAAPPNAAASRQACCG